MNKTIDKLKLMPFALVITFAGMLFMSGCARYARSVITHYEPSATVRNGSGEVYIIIPEIQQTQSTNIKWVIGKVKDDDNNTIDEVSSPLSPAEILQDALELEFKNAGYTVINATKRPSGEHQVIVITKSEIDLEQISDLAYIKSKCRLLMGVDIFKNGHQIKRLQYESTSSKTDVKDRDLLARNVLEDSLQSVMLKAVPELNSLFNR
jgi:hypothetical protein